MILTVTLNAAIDKRYVINDFKIDEVNRAAECAYFAGGKGLNVSRAATIAGAEVLATGFVGGHAGEYILEELDKQGIEADFVKVSGESRSCLNIYDTVNKTQTEILEPGVTIEGSDLEAFVKKYESLVPGCSVVSISGSVPKGLGVDVYPELVRIAKANGKKVICDTSGKLLEEVIKHSPSMIKPNADEIQMLTGKSVDSEADLIAAGREIVAGGVEQVVISLGGDGALMIREEGVYKAIVPKIDAVNTVGCGDCMTAGFAMAFEQGMAPMEALQHASAVGSAAAMTEETGFLRMEDYNVIKEQIVVEKL